MNKEQVTVLFDGTCFTGELHPDGVITVSSGTYEALYSYIDTGTDHDGLPLYRGYVVEKETV